jgi:hypothetical protein
MKGEELSVLLSRWLCSRCRAQAIGREDGMIFFCFCSSTPYVGSDLPLYTEIGQVQSSLGEFCLWSTCTGVQEGVVAAWMDLGGVVEPEKPWASSGCSVLTL